MAELRVEGDELVVDLSTVEKAEALHGDVRVPVANIVDVRTVADPWPELRGMRSPGTGIPGVIAVGTRRGTFGKDFAAVHGKDTAVVVDLEGADYQRLVVTDERALEVAAAINEARASGG